MRVSEQEIAHGKDAGRPEDGARRWGKGEMKTSEKNNMMLKVAKQEAAEKMVSAMYERHERLLANPPSPDYESTETGNDLISMGIAFSPLECEKPYLNMTIEQMNNKLDAIKSEQDKINKNIESIMKYSMRLKYDKKVVTLSITSLIFILFGCVAICNTFIGDHTIENQYILIVAIIGICIFIYTHNLEKRNARFIKENDEYIEKKKLQFDLLNRDIKKIKFSIERRREARTTKTPTQLANMANYIRTLQKKN